MKAGIVLDGSNLCGFLKQQEHALRRHSIYVLPDDEDTDYDFYVLVDSEEAREKNDFLQELFNFFSNADDDPQYDKFADESHKEWLRDLLGGEAGNKDLTVLNWLKIEIEKYPYRLFIISDDRDDYGRSNNFFLRRRLCWISRDEFCKAFRREDNQDILEVKDDKGHNILSDNQKFKPEQRAKLWLYYKWVEHLMESKGIESLSVGIHLGVSEREKVFYPCTLPSKGFALSPSSKEIIIGNRLKFKPGNIDPQSGKVISYLRHGEGPLAWGKQKLSYYNNLVYHAYLSGAMYSLPMFFQFEKLYIPLLLVENALINIGIVDERFINWFEKLDSLNKFRMIHRRIFPVEVIDSYDYSDYKHFELELTKGRLKVNRDYISACAHGLPDYLGSARLEEFKCFVNNMEFDIELIIFHQGILDKIKDITHLSLLELKDKIPYLIITSGRGKPPTIPRMEKFLPFSMLGLITKLPSDDILLRNSLMKVVERGG